MLRHLLPSARELHPIRARQRVGLARRDPDMRDANRDPGMAWVRPNLCECHPGATKQNTACHCGASVNNIHERDAMNVKTIAQGKGKAKGKAKSEYFGEDSTETAWLMMRMADRLTRHDLVAFRMSQFLRTFPKLVATEGQDFWNAQMRSLGL